jgi:phage terminase large subunit GpA-like protein
VTARTARRAYWRRFQKLRAELLDPSPPLSGSAWGAQHFRLSREGGDETGPLTWERNPAMREIADALADPAVEDLAVMAAAQVGKTTVVLVVVCSLIHQQPAPILVVLPTLDLARSWALERFATAVRDCRVLRGRVFDPASRDANTTMLARRFLGGTLWLTGANSAAALSARPVAVVVIDDADRAPRTVGGEGSPIDLAFRRATAFPGRRKRILLSSPTVRGTSAITQAFEAGDRRRYQVACLSCGARQPITWASIVWEKAEDGTHRPETAGFACGACGVVHPETDKMRLLAGGVWVPERPDVRRRSYHLPALAAPFLTWAEAVTEFLAVKADPHRLQVWVNTVLGEPTEPRDELPLGDVQLIERLERYPAEVPDGVVVLVGGVDVQDNRLALSLWGFGAAEESWLIEHDELFGSRAEDAVWAELDARLLRGYLRADGSTLHVLAAGLDTGGHYTQAAYRFAAQRQGRSRGRVVALKGHPNVGAPMLPARPSTANRAGVRLWSYGSTTVKDEFFGRLEVEAPGPRYVHLTDTVDREYLQQLLAERPDEAFSRGVKRRVYKKVRPRSEGLDCALLALLALHTFGLRFVRNLGRSVAPPADPEAPEAESPALRAATPEEVRDWVLRPRIRRALQRGRGAGWVQSMFEQFGGGR